GDRGVAADVGALVGDAAAHLGERVVGLGVVGQAVDELPVGDAAGRVDVADHEVAVGVVVGGDVGGGVPAHRHRGEAADVAERDVLDAQAGAVHLALRDEAALALGVAAVVVDAAVGREVGAARAADVGGGAGGDE